MSANVPLPLASSSKKKRFSLVPNLNFLKRKSSISNNPNMTELFDNIKQYSIKEFEKYLLQNNCNCNLSPLAEESSTDFEAEAAAAKKEGIYFEPNDPANSMGIHQGQLMPHETYATLRAAKKDAVFQKRLSQMEQDALELTPQKPEVENQYLTLVNSKGQEFAPTKKARRSNATKQPTLQRLAKQHKQITSLGGGRRRKTQKNRKRRRTTKKRA